MSNVINGQSAANTLSNEQLQVIITGWFGDGSIPIGKNTIISVIVLIVLNMSI